MKKSICLINFIFFFFNAIHAQSDSLQTKEAEIFERITKEMLAYVTDTSKVPNDKLTRAIIKLRDLRGGFNINEAIAFELKSKAQKQPAEELEKFSRFMQQREGKIWLDNAVIWIYRKTFSYKEVKTMIKFYETSVGQKMAVEFPLIMLKSAAAAEFLKKVYEGANQLQ